ncbi:PAS domain S-box-containing protein [Malonomonas rubra DSM 5091]|uniref:histidine kinase n=1 Tax=Malonomonas rubra DSM 5091 TaxID=1122189 RepID=A0A1M6JVS0_MALRU|nr:ATP-binding protein [Malonomonas rubra]SHJ50807.1 PAS domain S-box-containing protein [Malonomonas rubra DSM 5091]
MIAYKKPEKLTCYTIAISYASLGGMWTFFSDSLFAVLLNQPENSHKSVALSHWLFIAFSAILLYWLLRFWDVAISYSQESLREANRALRSISECTKAITRITDEQELMKEICRIFVKVGGYRCAWVGFAEQDEDKTLRPVAYWGFEDNFIDNMQATWADSERGRGPAGTTIRTGKTTVFQNFKTNPDYLPWRDAALRSGYESGISLPLREAGEVFGALVIFADEVNAFDPEEIVRMEELADDLSYGIKTIRMNDEREHALEERMLLAAAIEQASNGVLTFDRDGIIQYMNSSYEGICGAAAEDSVGKSIHSFECCLRNRSFYESIKMAIDTGMVQSGHFDNERSDGNRYVVHARISPVRGATGSVSRYVVIVRDVTNETQLQRQLRQAQKLEAIATLSGGIAHDFNNILAVIITNTEMTLEDIPDDDPLKKSLEIVLKAGFRGKDLVKQILTLSRRTEQEKQPVQIANIVEECFNLLRASLPTTIEVKKWVANDVGEIAADPTQIHQVVMNLCTNAADAMRENGGSLGVVLEEVELDEDACKSYPGLEPGEYIELQVSDTGHGMDRETMERIFDPFYSTKTQGKGTGLGLSVVHGIIKGYEGAITVDSVPDRGTIFSVLFPKLKEKLNIIPQRVVNFEHQGNERILFVDDEEDYVRGKAKMLSRMGYSVTPQTDSRKCLELFRANPNDFDLVITDQTMPNMTGEALARELLAIRPDLPIILCSGSSPETDPALRPENAQSIGIREVLLKPVGKDEMNDAIRRQLNAQVIEMPRGEYAKYSYHR